MSPAPASSNPLQGLRDIHLPAPVSFWPPAPGWWLLAGGVVLLMVAGLWWWRHYHKHRYRRQALQQLQGLRQAWQQGKAEAEVLGSISILLRRVAMTRYGRHPVAGLYGKAWLAFLDRTGRNTDFQSRGQALLDGPYRPASNGSAEAVLDLATRWLRVQS